MGKTNRHSGHCRGRQRHYGRTPSLSQRGWAGILVGDGRLPHPGPEEILETYYSLPLRAWKVTVDYQFVTNRGYNRDRGPVSVIGARLHAQF